MCRNFPLKFSNLFLKISNFCYKITSTNFALFVKKGVFTREEILVENFCFSLNNFKFLTDLKFKTR
jgi:hypothetical protein